MGVLNVVASRKGKNVSLAYELLLETYLREYGDDSYNGTFSTMKIGDETLRLKESDFESEEKLEDVIDEHIIKQNHGQKHYADYIIVELKDGWFEFIFYGLVEC